MLTAYASFTFQYEKINTSDARRRLQHSIYLHSNMKRLILIKERIPISGDLVFTFQYEKINTHSIFCLIP